MAKTKRTCPRGHSYYKTTDCPTCPVCEAEAKPADNFLSRLSAPARRALEHAGISTLIELAKKTEKEILSLHGMGPASMPTLRAVLAEASLSFSK